MSDVHAWLETVLGGKKLQLAKGQADDNLIDTVYELKAMGKEALKDTFPQTGIRALIEEALSAWSGKSESTVFTSSSVVTSSSVAIAQTELPQGKLFGGIGLTMSCVALLWLSI